MNTVLCLPELNAPSMLTHFPNTPALDALRRFGLRRPAPASTGGLWSHNLFSGSLMAHACAELGLEANSHAFFASPIHQSAALHHVDVLPAQSLSMSQADADALARALNDFCAQDGVRLHVWRPEIWLVQSSSPLPQWRAAPLPDVGGRMTQAQKPEGARQILRWQTEWQMLLHAHPLNESRRQAQSPDINALWLWPDVSGCLKTPAIVASPFAAWLPEGEQIQESTPHDWAAFQRLMADYPKVQHSVLWLDDLVLPARFVDGFGYHDALARLEADFLAPAWQALRRGEIQSLRLVTENMSLDLRARAHYAFWRPKTRFQGVL